MSYLALGNGMDLTGFGQSSSMVQSLPALNPPTLIENYRGWEIKRYQIDSRTFNPEPYFAQRPGTHPQFGLPEVAVNTVQGSTVQQVKDRIDGAIDGTYVPPEVAKARKEMHERSIQSASNAAFWHGLPVPKDQVHAQRSGSLKGSYKGWVIREHAYSLKSELKGLGFATTAIQQVAQSDLQSAPFHPLWVAVLDADPQQSLTANTEAELKAKIDGIMPTGVPTNAPVAAQTVSTGKKLAIGGGIAAVSIMMLMQ